MENRSSGLDQRNRPVRMGNSAFPTNPFKRKHPRFNSISQERKRRKWQRERGRKWPDWNKQFFSVSAHTTIFPHGKCMKSFQVDGHWDCKVSGGVRTIIMNHPRRRSEFPNGLWSNVQHLAFGVWQTCLTHPPSTSEAWVWQGGMGKDNPIPYLFLRLSNEKCQGRSKRSKFVKTRPVIELHHMYEHHAYEWMAVQTSGRLSRKDSVTQWSTLSLAQLCQAGIFVYDLWPDHLANERNKHK